MQILLIEDNLTIIKGLTYTLKQNNYEVYACKNLLEAISYLKDNPKINLIILDVTLPDGNGFTFFTNNLKNLNIPTIFLTAKDEEDDIVRGLEIGAEDYLTKPFSTKELLARINKILLRQKHNSILKVGDISFDMDKMLVYKDTIKLELTPLELKLLHLLFLNLNKLVSRNTILDKIYEWTGNDVDSHTITVYFQRIRQKLGTDIISTVKGLGYRIDHEK
ncbi:MAG: response regulator transcription factor [Bacilli bacterium]|nr:response regulator transcription factor [Bacilli bacterium]